VEKKLDQVISAVLNPPLRSIVQGFGDENVERGWRQLPVSAMNLGNVTTATGNVNYTSPVMTVTSSSNPSTSYSASAVLNK
jgi:hypothetical protein